MTSNRTRQVAAGRGAPAVSVIMATYNGAAFLPATVGSLLRQTFDDFELIAVDDCSTDSTFSTLHSFGDPRIRILSTARNAGPVAARNIAADAARGRYIAALDQDDLCHPDRLQRQVAYMEDHPRVAVLGTAARRLVGSRIEPDRAPSQTTPGLIRWMLHVTNPLVWSSVMIRTDAAHGWPVFSRSERQFAEDFDLYHRLSRDGEIARLDDILLTYRCHPQGASRTRRAQMMDSAAAVLADAYRELGLPRADWMAELMTRHVAGRQPVPDRATAAELARHLTAMTALFVARHTLDAASRLMVEAECSKLRHMLTRGWVQAGMRGRLEHVRTRWDHPSDKHAHRNRGLEHAASPSAPTAVLQH